MPPELRERLNQIAMPIFVVASLVLSGADAAPLPQWMLMARHGECMQIASLKRKVPDLGDIADPHAFAKFMRAKGDMVTLTDTPENKGKMVEVDIPAKGLALIFVVSQLCRKADGK